MRGAGSLLCPWAEQGCWRLWARRRVGVGRAGGGALRGCKNAHKVRRPHACIDAVGHITCADELNGLPVRGRRYRCHSRALHDRIVVSL